MRYVIVIFVALSHCGCGEQPSVTSVPSASAPQSVESAPHQHQVADVSEPSESADFDLSEFSLSDIGSVKLKPAPQPRINDHQIANLIASLASLDNEDVGLSSTVSGEAFLPIKSQTAMYVGLLPAANLEAFNALKQLVEAGPSALPLLLAHLDDKTPTRLKIGRHGWMTVMWFGNGELWGNPLNVKETSLFTSSQWQDDLSGTDTISSYTVTVGDVCFVAIGQITGRGYQAVRYQPSNCIVINSPTHDESICAKVRDIWQSDNPREHLFDSLLRDYAIRGKFDGVALGGSWSIASDLQVSAALRLLFYFPDESGELIAERVRGLNVSLDDDESLNGFVQRQVDNNVYAPEFIDAVAWSECSHITTALAYLREHATDASLFGPLGMEDDR